MHNIIRVENIICPKFPFSQRQTNIFSFVHRNYWKNGASPLYQIWNYSSWSLPYTKFKFAKAVLEIYLGLPGLWIHHPCPLATPCPSTHIFSSLQSSPEHPLPKGTTENKDDRFHELKGSLTTEKPSHHYTATNRDVLSYLTMSILPDKTERQMTFYFECQNSSPVFQQK